MNNSICPKCGKDEIMSEIPVVGGNGYPPKVKIVEPEPEKHPFIWVPGQVDSQFRANICGACGYTEFYATNYKELNEGWKKGFKSA